MLSVRLLGDCCFVLGGGEVGLLGNSFAAFLGGDLFWGVQFWRGWFEVVMITKNQLAYS
jgi:hypothetical protein